MSIINLNVYFIFFSCNSQVSNTKVDEIDNSKINRDSTGITVTRAERKFFISKIITNGKVSSRQEISMRFPIQGILEQINVINGASVKKGQMIASLKNNEQKLALQEAKILLEESKVEVNDQIITQGGKKGDTSSINQDVLSYIKLRSGYDKARLAVQKAELELSKTYLFSPIDGTVANLTSSSFSTTPSDKPFCMLLDNKKLMIRCSILESELSSVEINQLARILVINKKEIMYEAKVASINPIVNPNGLIDVTLEINNPDKDLLSGMNVKVTIVKKNSSQIIIPRIAVIERNGRKVVFTYENGRAKWNYVITQQENDKEVVVVDGIKVGDKVIISGNTNLGHNAIVKIE